VHSGPRQTKIRNIVVNGNRTTIRLDVLCWDALEDIAARQHITVRQIVAEIDRERVGYTRSEAIRIYILQFYRTALAGVEADLNQLRSMRP